MSNVTCDNDFDCPGALRCITKEVFWSSEKQFCTCYYFYGYTGINCTEKGPQTYFAVTSNSIMIIVTGFIILLCFRDIFWFITHRQFVTYGAALLSWFYSANAMVLFLVWRILYLVTALDPNLHKTRLEGAIGTTGAKTQRYNVETRIITSVMFAFTVCALLSISIMWLEVSYRAKALVLEKNSSLIKNFYRANYGTQAVYIAIIFIMLLLDEVVLLAFISLPFILAIIITYAVGQRRLSKVISKMIPKNDSRISAETTLNTEVEDAYGKVLSNVNRTAKVILTCLFLLILASIGMTVLDPKLYGDLTAPGEISVHYLFSDVFAICILMVLITINNYIRDAWADVMGSTKKDAATTIANSKSARTDSKNSTFAASI